MKHEQIADCRGKEIVCKRHSASVGPFPPLSRRYSSFTSVQSGGHRFSSLRQSLTSSSTFVAIPFFTTAGTRRVYPPRGKARIECRFVDCWVEDHVFVSGMARIECAVHVRPSVLAALQIYDVRLVEETVPVVLKRFIVLAERTAACGARHP